MSDDTIVPTEEEISGQVAGSAETLEDATPEEAETEKLVPERDLLRIKDDRDKLKARLKELELQRKEETKTSPDIESLSAKYQVDADFLKDVARLIDKMSDDKIAPLRNQAQLEKQEKKLDTLLDEQLALADGIDTTKVDRQLLKALALTPQYRNVPIKDLAEKLYKVEEKGRATTENDMRPATDLVTDVVDTT
jgi:hypothetical protein